MVKFLLLGTTRPVRVVPVFGWAISLVPVIDQRNLRGLAARNYPEKKHFIFAINKRVASLELSPF
jgi:hypothetical protein